MSSTVDESMSLVAQVTSNDLKLADSFRLWITTQPDSGRLIPGMYLPDRLPFVLKLQIKVVK